MISTVVSSHPKPRLPAKSGSKSPSQVASATGIGAVEAGELPWQLVAPISREVVLAGPQANELLIAGGLSQSGSSDSGIYALNTANGRLTSVGNLSTPSHDAAGALLGSHGLVLGGGSTTPSATTQRFVTDGTALSSGSLPEARADATAVTIGATAYVVGGYDGPSLDAEVLATTDGTRFAKVVALPVPARYAAVAALDGRIYVFGGQASNGRPLRTVQVIDPSTHTAALVGQLPLPITGATAANVGGTIYLAGGESPNGSSALQPIVNIYAFDPVRSDFLRAGSLPVAVTNAGAAVLGTRLWIVGGETAGGAPSAAVQMIQREPGRGRGVGVSSSPVAAMTGGSR